MFPNEGESIVIAEGRTEIRCPGKFNKLFLVLRQEYMPQPGMLMEIACADCAKFARANGAPEARRVLHYYDAKGTCVTSKVTSKD